jgi:hypothetical protein
MGGNQPALTLRGVPSATSTGAFPSEAPAMRTPSASAPAAKIPSALDTQTANDTAMQSQLAKGSGISQIANPYARNALRGVNVLGDVASAFIPQIGMAMRAIPGTEEHHNMLVGRNQRAMGQDQAEAAQQATTAKTQAETGAIPAETDLKKAQTEKALHPTPDKPESPEQVIAGIMNEDLDKGVKPGDDPRIGQASDVITGLHPEPKVPVTPEKSADIKDFLDANKLPDTPANREKARTAIANRGKQEPGSYMPLYDEKGHVTGAWDPKTGRVQKTPQELPGNTAQGHGIQEKSAGAATKEAQPYQQMVDNAAQAHQLADMAGKGNASADVDLVLEFFKMMRGTGGANIRFTQQEQNLILGARNAGNALMAVGQKVVGEGQPLTPEQRANMVAVIDMHGKAAQAHLDGMKQGAAGQGGGQGSGAQGGSTIRARDPQGKLHEAPAGTALPAGWKPE